MRAHFQIEKYEKLDSLIDYIRLGEEDRASQKNAEGMSLLQMASSRGLQSVVLTLLHAGADVNAVSYTSQECSLWLAIKNGHFLVAEILYTCGASKDQALKFAREHKSSTAVEWLQQLKPQHAIICGILFWEIHQPQRNRSLLSLMQPLLLSFPNGDKTFHQEAKRSAWDVSGMFEPLLVEDMQMQLSHLISLASEKDCRELVKKAESLSLLPSVSRAAEFKHDELDGYHKNVCLAFERNDFHALSKLHQDSLSNHLLTKLISSNQISLAKFWFIVTNESTYSLTIKFDNQFKSSKPLYNFSNGLEGILKDLIMRLVHADWMDKTLLVKALKKIPKSNFEKFNVLLDILRQRYQERIPAIEFEYRGPELYLITTIRDSWLIELLHHHANLLEITIIGLPARSSLPLPSNVMQITWSYLTAEEKKHIISSDHEYSPISQSLQQLDHFPITKIENDIITIQKQMEIVQTFLDAVAEVFKKKRRWSDCVKYTGLSTLTLGSIAVVSLLSNYYYHVRPLLIDERRKVKTYEWSSQTCGDLRDAYDRRSPGEYVEVSRNCEPLFDLLDGDPKEWFVITMDVLCGIVALLSPLIMGAELRERSRSTPEVYLRDDFVDSHKELKSTRESVMTLFGERKIQVVHDLNRAERIHHISHILPQMRELQRNLMEERTLLDIEYKNHTGVSFFAPTPITPVNTDETKAQLSEIKVDIPQVELTTPLLTSPS